MNKGFYACVAIVSFSQSLTLSLFEHLDGAAEAMAFPRGLIRLRGGVSTLERGMIVAITGTACVTRGVGRRRASERGAAVAAVVDLVPVLQLREPRFYVLEFRRIQLVQRLRRQQRVDLLLGFRYPVRRLRMRLEGLRKGPRFVLLHGFDLFEKRSQRLWIITRPV